MTKRRGTATSNFGVGGRENHDATAFYGRFRPPQLTDDDTVRPPAPLPDPFFCGDARAMDGVDDGSVALVVTSPPYFAGKQYEEELEREGIPATYLEYLDLLRAVFAECVRTLEPGGRIAVNVANLGRKPYRSLSSDVIRILETDLGLLLRGEIIWQKAEGANGSCAWGSYRSASNPVLRDITERVIVASNGRFDRAKSSRQRLAAGLPHESTVTTDDFLATTLDVWSIPAESARRVGHPAPFPVELPEQLIRLYTFKDDLVLDPFMGSGSTLVAAATLGRRYAGYDLDPHYVELARQRVADVVVPHADAPATADHQGPTLAFGASTDAVARRAIEDGTSAPKLAVEVLEAAGFTIIGTDRRVRNTAVAVGVEAADAAGDRWYFDVAGGLTSHRPGLQRMDVVWRCLGRASAVGGRVGDVPYVLLTTHLPPRRSDGDTALRAAGPTAFFDAVELLSASDRDRLRRYATGGCTTEPQPGFWTVADLTRRGLTNVR